MDYLRPKNGATVTIFAPYDCKNKCPFCINKKDYIDNPSFNIDNVIVSMYKMNAITPNCDFVITGGEPLADVEALGKLLKNIRFMNLTGANHKVFINTTLPLKAEDAESTLAYINSFKDVITMINISRHIKKYVTECPDEYFALLEIPVRINCVLYDWREAAKGQDLVERFYEKYNCIKGIQFRDNYIGVGPKNLFNQDDNVVLKHLCESLGVNREDLVFNTNSFRWNTELKENIRFHRTQCFSKIVTDEGIFIGDVIIDPRGMIKDDWNEHGIYLDLTKYRLAKEV